MAFIEKNLKASDINYFKTAVFFNFSNILKNLCIEFSIDTKFVLIYQVKSRID